MPETLCHGYLSLRLTTGYRKLNPAEKKTTEARALDIRSIFSGRILFERYSADKNGGACDAPMMNTAACRDVIQSGFGSDVRNRRQSPEMP